MSKPTHQCCEGWRGHNAKDTLEKRSLPKHSTGMEYPFLGQRENGNYTRSIDELGEDHSPFPPRSCRIQNNPRRRSSRVRCFDTNFLWYLSDLCVRVCISSGSFLRRKPIWSRRSRLVEPVITMETIRRLLGIPAVGKS